MSSTPDASVTDDALHKHASASSSLPASSSSSSKPPPSQPSAAPPPHACTAFSWKEEANKYDYVFTPECVRPKIITVLGFEWSAFRYRIVAPYFFDFQAHVKQVSARAHTLISLVPLDLYPCHQHHVFQRWRGRGLIEVFSTEFPSASPSNATTNLLSYLSDTTLALTMKKRSLLVAYASTDKKFLRTTALSMGSFCPTAFTGDISMLPNFHQHNSGSNATLYRHEPPVQRLPEVKVCEHLLRLIRYREHTSYMLTMHGTHAKFS
jgi:hypothetical protein